MLFRDELSEAPVYGVTLWHVVVQNRRVCAGGPLFLVTSAGQTTNLLPATVRSTNVFKCSGSGSPKF